MPERPAPMIKTSKCSGVVDKAAPMPFGGYERTYHKGGTLLPLIPPIRLIKQIRDDLSQYSRSVFPCLLFQLAKPRGCRILGRNIIRIFRFTFRGCRTVPKD